MIQGAGTSDPERPWYLVQGVEQFPHARCLQVHWAVETSPQERLCQGLHGHGSAAFMQAPVHAPIKGHAHGALSQRVYLSLW